MDADARERELALEARVAELEQRLQRLEAAQVAPTPAASTPIASTPIASTPAAPTLAAAARLKAARQAADRAAAARAAMAELATSMPVPERQPAPAAVPWVPQQAAGVAAEPEWLRATRAASPGTPTAAPTARPKAPPTAPPTAPPAPAAPRASLSLTDLEARLTGRALAWVGGLALVLGAIFFLSLAFTRGWIGPELRVVIGLVAGALSLVAGGVFLDRHNRLLGHVLTPVGLAIITISLVGATRLYGLIPVELGLILALASSIAAAAIAVRADSPIVAAFGLFAVLAAPPLLQAPADLATLAFVAVVLIGTTGVALWRSWAWPPVVAFLLAAPQVAVWILGRPDPLIGVIGLGGFWLINLVAAAGEEVRRHRDDLSASSATLTLANVAFFVWAGFALLSGDLEMYRGLFLAIVAIAHLAVGAAFVRRDGEADLFGLLTIGTGLAALAMAAPVQFGADVIPIAWTAEAVALTWVAARRGHPYSASVAGVLFLLAGGYLVQTLLPQNGFTDGPSPMPGGLVGSLTFFLAGTGVGLWYLRDQGLRYAAAAYAIFVTVLCILMTLDDVPLALALSAALVLAAAVPWVLRLLPNEPIRWQTTGLIPPDLQATEWRPAARWALRAVLALNAALATTAVAHLYGPNMSATDGIPFVDMAGAALLIYLASLGVTASLLKDERNREPIAALGLLVTAWALGWALDGVAVVVSWSALLLAGFVLWTVLRMVAKVPRPRIGRLFEIDITPDMALPGAALVVGALAALHLGAFELPIWNLSFLVLPAVPFTDAGTIAALSLALTSLLVGALVGVPRVWRASIIAAGAILAYLVPFEVAPWAVVVLWAGFGVVATGLSRRDEEGRKLFITFALLMVGAAATLVLGEVAPVRRLVVGNDPVDAITALQSAIALAAVTAALVVIAWAGRPNRWARWIGIAAGATFVYLASVLLVDVAAIQVGGSVPVAELRTWGQVGLSVLWAILGLVGFVAGLRWQFAELRHAGLALLGLATVKVFLFDLSALDVAYRVVTLIALGLLLLAGAWLWQRQQPGATT